MPLRHRISQSLIQLQAVVVTHMKSSLRRRQRQLGASTRKVSAFTTSQSWQAQLLRRLRAVVPRGVSTPYVTIPWRAVIAFVVGLQQKRPSWLLRGGVKVHSERDTR